MASKDNQTVVNVSPRLNALDQDEDNHQEQHDTNVTISPMEPPALADDLENGTSQLNKGNPVTKMNVPDVPQSPDSDASKYEGPAAKTRKLSDGSSKATEISLLETSQFNHSHTSQVMTPEKVTSDQDSKDEVDYYIIDIEERQTFCKLEDETPEGKRIMFLWNSFVRKQRVFAIADVPWACEAFSKLHRAEFIRSTPLHWSWRLFLLKLWNHRLLSDVSFSKCNLIIEDIKDDSDNTSDNNSVDLDSDLNSNNTMDANDNSVDGGIDLNSNETMDVNKNCVGGGIGLNSNGTMDVNKNSVGRGNDHRNCNDVMCTSSHIVDLGFDLNEEYVADGDEDVNDNEDK